MARDDNTFAAVGILLLAVLIIAALVWLAVIALGGEVPAPAPGPEPAPAADRPRGPGPVPAGHADGCVQVNVRTPREIPLSLMNSYQSHEFLYWVRVKVENRCERLLQLTIYLKPNQSELETLVEFDANRRPFVGTVPQGRAVDAAIDTMFRFIKRDDPTRRSLPVIWVVEDKETGRTLNGTAQLTILPRNVLNWGLVTPDLALPKDFLFASLAAWVARPEPAVKRYAEKLMAELPLELPAAEFARAWFETLYRHFFSAEAEQVLLPVNPMREWRYLPPAGEQAILVPEQVLENGGRVDSIEATLLLVALTRAAGQPRGVPVVLFALGREPHDQPEIVLAWATGANRWAGISISRARELDFAANLAQYSQVLNELAERHPDLNRALDGAGGKWSLGSTEGHGVYLNADAAVMAIDFEIAARQYQIRGLP